MGTDSKTSSKSSREKSARTKSTEKKDSSSSKSQSKSSSSKTEAQYTNQSRTWPTDNCSREEISSGSKSTQAQTGSTGNANVNTQTSYSSNQTTPMERWELETQQESPWNGVGQYQNMRNSSY